MENKKPEFAFSDYSVITLVTEMRSYFQDLKSYYSISKGEVISQLETAKGASDIENLQTKLQEIEHKIAYFSVLSDSLSIADTIMHTDSMIAELDQTSK